MYRENSRTPGENLYYKLISLYPYQRIDSSWCQRITVDFGCDLLPDHLYQSTILMVLRRVLTNARWYLEKYEHTDTSPVQRFQHEYLRQHHGLARTEAKTIAQFAFAAVNASRQEIPHSTSNLLRRQAERLESPCTLCGGAIDYDNNDTPRSFSLDHIWPRFLGGSSDASNLRPCCRRCNSGRKDIAALPDIHYEHFSLTAAPEDRDSFLKQLEISYRTGLVMSKNFRCEQCSAPTSTSRMYIFPRERAETLNAFNALVLCERCSHAQ